MTKIEMSIPQLAFVAITRGLGGLGLGLLLSSSLRSSTRRRAGWALLTLGVVTTVPIAVGILWQRGRLSKAPSAPSRLALRSAPPALNDDGVIGLS